MSAQQQPRTIRMLIEEKGIVHLPRRMAFGEIELREVVIVGLDVGPLCDSEPHVCKDRRDLVHHLADWMDTADICWGLLRRQGHVDGFRPEPFLKGRILENLPTC